MTKVILNNSKNLEIISNGGRYKIIAKMKVDYDVINDVFGARYWFYNVVDLIKNKNVNLQSNGIDCFKYKKYQFKKQLMIDIEDAKVFSIAISELKNKSLII